jgi:hypothetical protein
MSDETNPQPADAAASAERDIEEEMLEAWQRTYFPQLEANPVPATPQPVDAEEAALREFERRYFPQLPDDAG